MINRFREWLLDVVGAYDTDFVRGKISEKPISKKEITKLKKESVPKEIIKESKKITKKRPIPEEYEIDNVLMQLDPELPTPKKYKIVKTYTEEEKLLYHFRFINYTEESFDLLRNSLKNNLALPDNFERFSEYLHLKKNRLYFKDLPILRPQEIQSLCRNIWFDPTKPFSPDKIYQLISNQAANLSRSKIRKAIQSIEQYQLRRELRRPKEVEANFIVTSSNTMVCDMFWINKIAFFNCAEAFSGYIKTYHVKSGTAQLIKSCVEDFIKEIKNYGKTISRLICDRGTENQKLKDIPNLNVIFTKVAQPMHLCEYFNSLVAKRINLYLDLGLDPSEILELILVGLNNRKRKRRNHFSPIEILEMNTTQQKRIASDIIYRLPQPHYNMKKIHVGSYVRILKLSRKDQRVRPMSYKGYKKKYSEEVYRVKSIKIVRGTLNVFKYNINGTEYFRNELLLIPEFVDKKIPEFPKKPFSYPIEDDDDSSGIYVPSDIESEDDY